MRDDDEKEQLRLDLEESQNRLEAVRKAVMRKEQADEQVRTLGAALRQAKGEQKQAGYELALLLSGFKRKGGK